MQSSHQEQEILKLSRTANTAAWAVKQLHILADMAEDRNMSKWFVKEIRRIENGIEF